jgi:drug/metabolite transporter (DMT)-like permease
MNLLPILIGLFAAICWGVSDYLVAKPSRKIGHYATTAYMMLFSTLTLLPSLVYTGINFHIDSSILIIAFLSAIISFLGFFFAFRAFRYGNLSITAPIVGANPAITVAASVLVLGLVLSNIEIFSIIILILGIILLSTKMSAFRTKKRILVSGAGSALLSMIFFGMPAVMISSYTAIIGFALLSIMWRGVSSGLGFLTGFITKQRFSLSLLKQFIIPLVFAGVADAIAILAFLYGISIGSSNLPIISSLAGFAGGVTVILALVILKERPEKNQWLGILLVIAGAVILSYFS